MHHGKICSHTQDIIIRFGSPVRVSMPIMVYRSFTHLVDSAAALNSEE